MAKIKASLMWKALKGIVCVYKPADVSVRLLQKQFISKLCKSLNEVHVENFYDFLGVDESAPTELTVQRCPDLTRHPLVEGPRYEEMFVRSSWANYLGYNTSGVLLIGLRTGSLMAKRIRENKPTRAYRIKGVFGKATENAYKDGRVVERSTWKHIKSYQLERMLASMQAAHQKKMFEMCGVDMQSQLAYELAIKGPIRPANSKLPIIYGIKCVEYKGPEFTLEIQCINEYETYLKTLIHEIGVKLHSTAHCTDIKCIRHSCFTLDNALLYKHWTLENILSNMQQNKELLKDNSDLLKQDNIALRSR